MMKCGNLPSLLLILLPFSINKINWLPSSLMGRRVFSGRLLLLSLSCSLSLQTERLSQTAAEMPAKDCPGAPRELCSSILVYGASPLPGHVALGPARWAGCRQEQVMHRLKPTRARRSKVIIIVPPTPIGSPTTFGEHLLFLTVGDNCNWANLTLLASSMAPRNSNGL